MKKALIIAFVVLAILAVIGFLGYRKITRTMSGENLPTLESAGAALAPGTYQDSLETSDGRTRTYIIHIPERYDAAKAYPLVLLFHGGGPAGTGTFILRGTRFDQQADDEGFIVVAPNGYKQSWNDGRNTTFAYTEGIDDVQFIRELTAELSRTLPIDEKRVYAAGASNGGFMSLRLGCELSGIFAAVGPVIASMPTNVVASCNPGPISVVGIQGSADPGVRVEGGEMGGGKLGEAAQRSGRGQGGVIESADATMRLWAAKNSCNPEPVVTHLQPKVEDGTSVGKYVFSGCTAGAAVEYYIVNGMGHTWPPNKGIRPDLSGTPSANLDATDVIWAFFEAHPKP